MARGSRKGVPQARVGVALLARQIARDLFTNGNGDHAGRLVMLGDNALIVGRDLGGLSERAVVDRIEAALLRGRYQR
jgi:hypothetical protein